MDSNSAYQHSTGTQLIQRLIYASLSTEFAPLRNIALGLVATLLIIYPYILHSSQDIKDILGSNDSCYLLGVIGDDLMENPELADLTQLTYIAPYLTAAISLIETNQQSAANDLCNRLIKVLQNGNNDSLESFSSTLPHDSQMGELGYIRFSTPLRYAQLPPNEFGFIEISEENSTLFLLPNFDTPEVQLEFIELWGGAMGSKGSEADPLEVVPGFTVYNPSTIFPISHLHEFELLTNRNLLTLAEQFTGNVPSFASPLSCIPLNGAEPESTITSIYEDGRPKRVETGEQIINNTLDLNIPFLISTDNRNFEIVLGSEVLERKNSLTTAWHGNWAFFSNGNNLLTEGNEQWGHLRNHIAGAQISGANMRVHALFTTSNNQTPLLLDLPAGALLNPELMTRVLNSIEGKYGTIQNGLITDLRYAGYTGFNNFDRFGGPISQLLSHARCNLLFMGF